MRIKTVATYLIINIVSFLLSYLAIAFIYDEYNVSNWSKSDRGVMLYISFFIMFFISAINYYSYSDE